MQLKKQIRYNHLNLRNNFSNDYINNISKIISYKLFDLPVYKQCESIFIYLSIEKEIDTSYILKKAQDDNKHIYCPVITKNKREIIFKKYNKKT